MTLEKGDNSNELHLHEEMNYTIFEMRAYEMIDRVKRQEWNENFPRK
jgi:hypothetical protein